MGDFQVMNVFHIWIFSGLMEQKYSWKEFLRIKVVLIFFDGTLDNNKQSYAYSRNQHLRLLLSDCSDRESTSS